MPHPFELNPNELDENTDLTQFIDAVYESLEPSQLIMPTGDLFIRYDRFQSAYEVLKRHTQAFTQFTRDHIWAGMEEDAFVFVVLRVIIGLTPPELAYLATSDTETEEDIPPKAARSIEASVRANPDYVSRLSNGVTKGRLRAMLDVACRYIASGVPTEVEGTIHRLDKFDTKEGLTSLRAAALLDVPYATVLYERFLGRPFATHRDAVSELVGDIMENAVAVQLDRFGISYRKTRRAERLPEFDQAPDIIVPDEFTPSIVIEAKMASDDGTARDKFTRLINLVNMSEERIRRGQHGFEVVACIDGRGFGERREDMRQLILRTKGKVFTMQTLEHLVPYTNLQRFITQVDTQAP